MGAKDGQVGPSCCINVAVSYPMFRLEFLCQANHTHTQKEFKVLSPGRALWGGGSYIPGRVHQRGCKSLFSEGCKFLPFYFGNKRRLRLCVQLLPFLQTLFSFMMFHGPPASQTFWKQLNPSGRCSLHTVFFPQLYVSSTLFALFQYKCLASVCSIYSECSPPHPYLIGYRERG